MKIKSVMALDADDKTSKIVKFFAKSWLDSCKLLDMLVFKKIKFISKSHANM